ncbi:MAG: LL-diaminopimelate aminotransferase [Oscillospiraceae bacterium]|jgi:LL-diaminopimelate aminotransferase|nr:LL-diaminopimelate aminotransferase [Oscillospiraceae bacterium]
MNVNRNYAALHESYLFSDIAARIRAHASRGGTRRIIRLGIGDVTLPLAPVVTEAMSAAAAEMSCAGTFRGYGEEQGYAFLREAVCGYYASKGVNLDADEVFISDGAKSDLGNMPDIFALDNTVLITDPVYPVYVDSNVMAGRPITYITGDISNGFLPLPSRAPRADIVYLCSPGNPTGAVYTKEQLALWVDYALRGDAVILFDSAYERFVRQAHLPTSIYQIPGADKCAIEFCSLSKTAGFTGTRCGYTVVPRALTRGGASLNKLWLRRQTTKFNGVAYVVQRGAQAVFTREGLEQTDAQVAYYLQNARVIAEALEKKGLWHTGGVNSPYVWCACPDGMNSWEYFDYLLENADIAGTPGAGFGSGGEGFFRFSAFCDNESARDAADRIKKL